MTSVRHVHVAAALHGDDLVARREPQDGHRSDARIYRTVGRRRSMTRNMSPSARVSS